VKHRRTIERTFRRMSLLVAVAIGLVLLYLGYLATQLDDTNTQERRSSRVVSYALALELRTIDLETAQRGYVLTGDESFLAPYRNGLERIAISERGLRGLVAHDPVLRARVDDVLRDLHAYVDEFATPNLALARRDREAARRTIASKDGKRRIDDVRREFTHIVSIERARRDARADQAQELVTRAKVASALAIGGVLLVLGLFIGFVGRVVIRPMRELRDVVVRIATGDLRARPTQRYRGEAEELATAVTTMTVELQSAHESLERRAQEIQDHATALERSNADLEQFAYAAAHDLQEPLRMVASYTGLLEKRYKGQLDDDADEFIRYAVDGAKRMQRLINDLLTYSRVNSSSSGTVSDIAIKDAVDEAIENLAARIEDRSVDLDVDIDAGIIVHAQRGQMVMLMQNLIGNALRFADSDTPHVHIVVRAEQGSVVGCIDDDGPGIEPQYRERVFRIFQRLGARDEHAGTGIGLALCRRIVERHGGHIRVEDAPLGGARFVFELPAVEGETRTSAAPVLELQ
jgi:signal transduction histidine kinase